MTNHNRQKYLSDKKIDCDLGQIAKELEDYDFADELYWRKKIRKEYVRDILLKNFGNVAPITNEVIDSIILANNLLLKNPD